MHPTATPLYHHTLLQRFNFSCTAIINVLGLPSTACPLGFNKQGLPIVVQVVGGLYPHRLTLVAAQVLEHGTTTDL